jgi:hypothetical protein
MEKNMFEMNWKCQEVHTNLFCCIRFRYMHEAVVGSVSEQFVIETLRAQILIGNYWEREKVSKNHTPSYLCKHFSSWLEIADGGILRLLNKQWHQSNVETGITGCFKKNFTTLKEYTNLYREMCSKMNVFCALSKQRVYEVRNIFFFCILYSLRFKYMHEAIVGTVRNSLYSCNVPMGKPLGK